MNIFRNKKYLKNIIKKELPNFDFGKKHGFSHDFGDWPQNVGYPYLKSNWKDYPEVNRLLDFLNNNNESKYFNARYIWKFYSLFKWLDINNVEIKD